MPYASTLLGVRCKQSESSEWETRCYIASADCASRTPEGWANRIRAHWQVESAHWRKDATLREDDTRTRNPAIMSNLIQLRNIVLFYYLHHGREQAEWLPIWVENNQHDNRSSLSLVTRNRP